MFKRSFHSKDRAGKAVKPSKRSFREAAKLKMQQQASNVAVPAGTLISPVITLVIGRDQRLFACHQDVLSRSPYLAARLRGQYYDSFSQRIELLNEEPEVFSSVLEFLYKGDYYPRLAHDKRRNSWVLEDAVTDTNNGRGLGEPAIFHHGVGGLLLKDTAIYCSAERYGLDELKRLSLRKQGLRTGIQVDTILRSARYAYENTPDHDAKLRAHFLALIIRSRKTFKRSGTMQMEMEIGGSKLFFDLFVAMCNHIDDIAELTSKTSPRTI